MPRSCPALAETDPEGAYLTWTATLDTECDEAAVREHLRFRRMGQQPHGRIPGVAPGRRRGARVRVPADPDGASGPRSARARTARPRGRRRQRGGDADAAPRCAVPVRTRAPGVADDPRRPRPRRSADRPRRRARDQPGHAGRAGQRGGPRPHVAGRRGPRRAGAAHPRDPGQRHGDSGAAGEIGVPAHAAPRPRSGGRGGEIRPPRHRGREHRGRQDRDRAAVGSAHPHDLRNAIDHGLEKPEKRRAAGKPEEGQVRLSALHRSGRIVIEISDDGAGIDRERVRSIAIEKGLIPQDSRLSDDETGQPDLPARLLDGRDGLGHLRPGRRDGCGQALHPGARGPPSPSPRCPARDPPSP